MADTLAAQTRAPCKGGIPPLTQRQAEDLHGQVPGWDLCDHAHRIIQIEALSVDSLTFQLHVDADFQSDDEALSHLEYKGRHAFYIIKRQAG